MLKLEGELETPKVAVNWMRNRQFLFNHQKTLAKVATQKALILMKYNNDLAKTEKIISIANFLVWTLFFIPQLVKNTCHFTRNCICFREHIKSRVFTSPALFILL